MTLQEIKKKGQEELANHQKEIEEAIKNDLLDIAEKGEIEDLRREVENYFRQKLIN